MLLLLFAVLYIPIGLGVLRCVHAYLGLAPPSRRFDCTVIVLAWPVLVAMIVAGTVSGAIGGAYGYLRYEWPERHLRKAHKGTVRNREQIAAAGIASCIFCLLTVNPEQVVEYVDRGQTAICPHCGVDALIAGRHPINFLDRMHKFWFGVA